MAKRQYQYTVPRRRKRKYTMRPVQFVPKIWIDGPGMYATCPFLETKRFSDKQELDWGVQLAEELRENWDIDARSMTMEWEEEFSRYKLNFNDDEEFIMVKLIHG